MPRGLHSSLSRFRVKRRFVVFCFLLLFLLSRLGVFGLGSTVARWVVVGGVGLLRLEGRLFLSLVVSISLLCFWLR